MSHYPIEPNSLDQIEPLFSQIRLFKEIDSTNDEARRAIKSGVSGINLIIADSQTGGRGRRGRTWVSPAGGLYMSFIFPFQKDLIQPQALSLVAAISVKNSLEEWSLTPIKLKWPNDLLIEGKKLAGILLELETSGKNNHVVFGIGVNYLLTVDQKVKIDREVTDLNEHAESIPARERVITKICIDLLNNVREFVGAGFAPFKSIWNESDHYLGSSVVISDGKSEKSGISLGVNDGAELIIESDSGKELISSGEIAFGLRELVGTINCDT